MVREKKSKADRPAKRMSLCFQFFPRDGLVGWGSETRDGPMSPAVVSTDEPMEAMLEQIDAYLGGWIGYFRFT